MALLATIDRFKKKLRRAGDEVKNLARLRAFDGGAAGERPAYGHVKERRRGGVAAVHFVAHQQGLGLDGLEVDTRFGFLDRGLERRRQHALHPLQPVYDLLAVCAKAQHLAYALGKIGVGHVAAVGVFNHEHRHRGRDGARHRSHRREVVVLHELDFTARQFGARLLVVLRPALVDHRADQRALHRAAHLVPGHRRAGMGQHTPALGPQLGPDFVGAQRHIHQHRLRGEHARTGLCIGAVDLRADGVRVGHVTG